MAWPLQQAQNYRTVDSKIWKRKVWANFRPKFQDFVTKLTKKFHFAEESSLYKFLSTQNLAKSCLFCDYSQFGRRDSQLTTSITLIFFTKNGISWEKLRENRLSSWQKGIREQSIFKVYLQKRSQVKQITIDTKTKSNFFKNECHLLKFSPMKWVKN